MPYVSWLTKLFHMTLTASVVICAVLLLRLLLKKAPKAVSCALWGLVLIRLLCPVSLPSRYSVFSLIDVPAVAEGAAASSLEYVREESVSSAVVSEAHDPAETDGPGTSSVPESAGQPDPSLPSAGWVADIPSAVPAAVSPAETRRTSLLTAAFCVWVCGVSGMLVYCLYAVFRLRRDLRISVRLRDNIYLADDLSSPVVVGLLRPRICLPCGLEEREQSFIILHEQYHIRRLDHVFKALGFLALTLHWFNPLVWLAFVLSSRDMEMSCDEAVIGSAGEDIRADYSASLLAFAAGRHKTVGLSPAFGESGAAGRIRNLAGWKKPAGWVVFVSILVCAAAAVCLLSNPKTAEQTVCITIPGGAEPGFYYSDEEIVLRRGRLLVGNRSGADTQFTLIPADADRSTAPADPVTIPKDRTAALPADRGTWYQLGIYTDNPSPVSKTVTVTLKNAETRTVGFPISWSVLEGILWTPGAEWEYESPDHTVTASLTVRDGGAVSVTVNKDGASSDFGLVYRFRGTKIFADFFDGAQENAAAEDRFLFTASVRVQKGDLIVSVTDAKGKDVFGAECAVFLHKSSSPAETADAFAPPTEIPGLYLCEQGGFGGDFTLTLNPDGTYRYYEGSFSSHLGMGTWESDGDTVTLHDPMGEDERSKYFSFHGTYLSFDRTSSSRFLYFDLTDGARFLRYDAMTPSSPAGLVLTVTDASADDMEFLLVNGAEMQAEIGAYNRVRRLDGQAQSTAISYSIEPFTGNRKTVSPGDSLYGTTAWSRDRILLSPGRYLYSLEVLCRDPETGEQYPVILEAEFEIEA